MIKLHLGCGKRYFPGWIHIDGNNYPHVVSHDITKLNFKNCSVDIIYASHVINYFDREEIIPILKEWYRVLKYDGILRLAVPDFDAIISLYYSYKYKKELKDTNNSKLFSSIETYLGPLYGKIKFKDTYIYHKTAYNDESLTLLLKNIGFKEVRRWDWRKVDHGIYDDHSQAYLPHMEKDSGYLISLNLESIK